MTVDKGDITRLHEKIDHLGDSIHQIGTAVIQHGARFDTIDAKLTQYERPCPEMRQHLTESLKEQERKDKMWDVIYSKLILMVIVSGVGMACAAIAFAIQNGWKP